MKQIFVIGGGISGLTSAYVLANSGKYKVHVVESSERLGGLLKSFDYGVNGHFDYGAHNILETGIKELDDFYLNVFDDEDDWQITTTINGQTRALTGLLYNQKLQQNSPFIDLRESPRLPEYIGDFFVNINSQEDDFCELHDEDAYSYSLFLFGPKITDEIIVPAIEKQYGRHPKYLNSMVLFLTQFTRVVLFEEHLMQELVHTKKIASRLSYTEQLNLPEQYLQNFKSLYPKKYGIYRVIEAIEKKLKDMGVNFHMNSLISDLTISGSEINTITMNEKEYNVDHVVSSIGLFPLSKLLQVNSDSVNPGMDDHPKTAITNFLLDKPLNCGELSFIYSYDSGSKIFRLDNYINYCEGAIRNGLYPISIESLHFTDIDVVELEKQLIIELKQYELLKENTEISFVKTEILQYGFPLLTQNNVKASNLLRDKINEQNLKNLTRVGILSEKGLFFESHVIKDAYKKIRDLI